jgi:hypothetical protein
VTTWNENQGLPRCSYPIKYRDNGCQLIAGRGTDHYGIGRPVARPQGPAHPGARHA